MISEGTSKPTITLGLPISKSNSEFGRAKWIEKEVQDFLYSGGQNPLTDVFEPNFERPNVHDEILRGMNICKDGHYPPEY